MSEREGTVIIKAYKIIESIWFKINQKIRFILVGGFNTLTSFLLYYMFLYLTQGREQVSLLLMNIININISITTMRYYVFQSHGNFKQEYLKAFSSYIVLYFINTGLLAFFVKIVKIKEKLSPQNILQEIPNLDKAIAQLCCIIIITILTFFVHKYFSFRKNDQSV